MLLKPSSVSYLFPCYYSCFIYLCFFPSWNKVANNFPLFQESWNLVYWFNKWFSPSLLRLASCSCHHAFLAFWHPFSTSMEDLPPGTMSWTKLHLLFKPLLSKCLVTAVIKSNYYTTQTVQVTSDHKKCHERVTRGPKRSAITRVLDRRSQSPLRPKTRTW